MQHLHVIVTGDSGTVKVLGDFQCVVIIVKESSLLIMAILK